MEWMESSITFGRHHRKQKEKEEESKTCTSVVWFASTRPIRCRSPPPPSRCRGGSGPPAAAEAAAAAAAARRLRQRGRRRLHRGRPWHRAPSGEKADPRKVAYTLAFVVSFDVGRICTTQTHEGELLQHFCQLGGLIFKDGQCLWPTPVDYCALRLGLQQTFVCTYLYMYVASQSSSSLCLLSLSAYTAVTQGALHRRRRRIMFLRKCCTAGRGTLRHAIAAAPASPHYRRLNISPLDVRPSVIVCASPLLSCFSFQGGFGASGPSQDQVFEAMEIFGEGIQDFDFNAADEDAEVHKVLMLSSHTYFTYLLCFPIWLDLNGVQM